MKNKGEVKHLYKEVSDSAAELDRPAIEKMGEVDSFSEQELDRLKVLYPGMSNQKILNTFRELRTQLLQKAKKNNFICMISSVNHGGGSTYVASNLAAVFSLDKTKTSLLIDANLYSPNLDNLVIGDAHIGITDYLSQPGSDIKDIVYATGVPRMRVIPLGDNREGAAEYFSSQKMSGFVEEVRSRYADRFIFVDAPPIVESSEARILTDIVDFVVVVVPHGGATPEQIESAINIVGKEKLVGLVYNN